MKIIALRGLPGSGKSYLAQKMMEQIPGLVVISVDQYKVEFNKNNPGQPFRAALQYSYKQALEKLERLSIENNPPVVVIEELFCDAEFVKSLQAFCEANNVSISWFQIERPMDQLLRVEMDRKRKIKNPPEVMKELETEIKAIRPEGEVIISNQGGLEFDEEIMRLVQIIKESDEPRKEIKLV